MSVSEREGGGEVLGSGMVLRARNARQRNADVRAIPQWFVSLPTLVPSHPRSSSKALRQSADKRAASLQSARRTSEHNTAHLVAMRSKYKESLDLLHQASAMVTIRQTRIILQLHTIYPVEQLSPSLFTICSMELPSAERSTASNADEEAVATALGYTAHFVVMIAKYLNVPFRYPIRQVASSFLSAPLRPSHARSSFFLGGGSIPLPLLLCA